MHNIMLLNVLHAGTVYTLTICGGELKLGL